MVRALVRQSLGVLLASSVFGFPAFAQPVLDTDADGVPDAEDLCPELFDPEQAGICEAPLTQSFSSGDEPPPLPAPQGYRWGALYDVDFEEPTHRVDELPAIGEGPAPRDVPTQIVFGTPTIVSDPGGGWPRDDQSLRFAVPVDLEVYDQIQSDLAQTHDGRGFEHQLNPYYFEVTVTIEAVEPGSPLPDLLSVIVDNPQSWQVQFWSNGTIYATWLNQIGTWEFGVPVRVGIWMHGPEEQWEVWLDGVQVHSAPAPRTCYPIFEGDCMRSLRVSSSGGMRARVDDILIQGSYFNMAIDVDPDREENIVLPFRGHPLTVVIFGGIWLPVGYFDLDSLALGDAAAEPIPDSIRIEDVDGDGLNDLLADFVPAEAGIRWVDEELCLRARFDFMGASGSFMGCDAIITWPGLGSCGLGAELAGLVPVLLWLRRRVRGRTARA